MDSLLTLCINLEGSGDRWAHMVPQLRGLPGRTERLRAVDGSGRAAAVPRGPGTP